MNLFELFNFLR